MVMIKCFQIPNKSKISVFMLACRKNTILFFQYPSSNPSSNVYFVCKKIKYLCIGIIFNNYQKPKCFDPIKFIE